MSNPSNPVVSTSPIPPPAINLPWGYVIGGDVMLTSSAIEFLQTLWASIQGDGGLIGQVLIDAMNPGSVSALAETVAAQVGANAELLATPAIPASVQALLDGLGAAQGSIIYRGADRWKVLPPGTAGFVLVTAGAAADPAWGSVSPSATTFAGLPGAPADGQRGFITDGSVVAAGNFGTVAAGGGANHLPVFWDGGTANWRIG